MDENPLAPSRPVRALIVFAVKLRDHSLLRWIWKKQTGLPHLLNICIKNRADEDLSEAFALRLVSEKTSIPVPKVYFAFAHRGSTYIVMQHLRGQMAVRDWHGRSNESKTKILNQLHSIVTELRSVAPPAGCGVSSVTGGPIFSHRLPSKLYWGPFSTVRQFHQELVENMDLDTRAGLQPDLAKLFQFYSLAENDVVLTHGDLSSLNIIVRGDRVVGIVDWETAGWFPRYWEYTCAKQVNSTNPLWADAVDHFIHPMPTALEMDGIRRKYFGDF